MDDFADDTSAFHFIDGAGSGSLSIPLRGTPAAMEGSVPRHHRGLGKSLSASPPMVAAKRAVDIILSALLLLALSPLLLLAALAVMASGRPVLFAQPRVGLNGRIFHCYKFRSMVPDAEQVLYQLLQRDAAMQEEWRRSQKLRRDPRVTRVGELLRRSSIDELPQLWNVLRGDMSLVGPRPVMVDQLALYGPLAACYTSTRPGITGLWQVTARGNADFRRRIALDCQYVQQYSLVQDFLILLKTIRVVISGVGAF